MSDLPPLPKPGSLDPERRPVFYPERSNHGRWSITTAAVNEESNASFVGWGLLDNCGPPVVGFGKSRSLALDSLVREIGKIETLTNTPTRMTLDEAQEIIRKQAAQLIEEREGRERASELLDSIPGGAPSVDEIMRLRRAAVRSLVLSAASLVISVATIVFNIVWIIDGK